ncbi:MAG: hypothetical protein LQ351_002301 [Letrouitia transgressa]|nr:MAG: hypothetical protein LQ351_002301 [Letrouitia transgressa]
MNNFIDELINTPRRQSKASLPANPASPNPPLPLTPTASAIASSSLLTSKSTKKHSARNVSFLGKESTSASGSQTTILPAQVPLPETPALLGASQSTASTEIPSSLGQQKAPSGYFSAADVPSLEPLSASKLSKTSVAQPVVDSTPFMLHIEPIPMPDLHKHPAILIGLSGSPLSGKTTIAHLLASILPASTPWFILDENDFFAPKHLLIPDANGDLDMGCRSAINFSALIRLMDFTKREGGLPPGFRSMQPEDETDGKAQILPEAIEQLQAVMAGMSCLKNGRPVGIVDGFFLYHDPRIRDLLDVKILLRCSSDKYNERRVKKSDNQGPDAEEEDWKEPLDQIVQRSFVQEHEVLFQNGNIEGTPIQHICEGIGIAVQPGLDINAEEALQWVVETICKKSSELEGDPTCDRRMEPSTIWKAEYEPCDCGEGWLGKLRQILYEIV